MAATLTASFNELNKRFYDSLYKYGERAMIRARSFTAIISLLILTTIVSFAQAVDSNNTANPNASNQQTSNLLVVVKQLSTEVKTLKAEVLKLRLEIQQTKVERLERELQDVRAAKKRVEAQDNELQRETAALDERLSQPIYENEERIELETAKAKLMERGLPRPRASQHQVSRQEAELSQRLAREQETWQELVEKAKKLGIEIPESLSTDPDSSRTSAQRER